MIKSIQKRLNTDESGFTLVELLVVMIIIAILMAIAVPIFLSQKNKAVGTGAKSTAKNIADWLDSCSASSTDGTYTNCAVDPTPNKASLKEDELGIYNANGVAATSAAPGSDMQANHHGFTSNADTFSAWSNARLVSAGSNTPVVIQFVVSKSALGVTHTCTKNTQLCPAGTW